jgi:hypothetical protein
MYRRDIRDYRPMAYIRSSVRPHVVIDQIPTTSRDFPKFLFAFAPSTSVRIGLNHVSESIDASSSGRFSAFSQD